MRPIRRPFRSAALSAALLASGLPVSGLAADNFSYTLTITPAAAGAPFTETRGFGNVQDFINSFDQGALESKFASYSVNDGVSFVASFRGIPTNVFFNPNSTAVSFVVPSLGINKTFSAANRDGSLDQLEDFLKKNGEGILSRIMKEAAKASPNDPVAGNPTSLMGTMVGSNFDNTFASQGSQIIGGPPQAQAGDQTNNFGLSLRFGSFKVNDVNTRTTTLPLSYTWRIDSDPRKQVVLAMPITYGTTEGARIGSLSPSISVSLPVNDKWTLTPTVGYGVTGSIDLASVAQIVSGSLMSMVTIPMDDWYLSVGNMVGHYKTLKVQSGEFSADPGIANTVFRNGFMVSQPVNFLGGDKLIEYSWVDTRYAGSALYMKWYDEVGITLGTARGATGLASYIRAGVSYLYSAGSKGYSLKFGYWF